MIAESAIKLGSRIAGDRVTGATAYWRDRVWDRDEAEASPGLGPEYVEERQRVTRLISELAQPGATAVDLACGTGAFSAALLETRIESLRAIDVSAEALALARRRIGADPRASFVERDFWSLPTDRPADLVVCIDALHHLGMPTDVLQRVRSLTRPGGYVIGNYWTGDHFHEFSRIRHGRWRHGVWSLEFLLAAMFARASRTHPGRLRTAWLSRREIEAAIRETFSHVEYLEPSRYFLTFAARP